ncbi:hypothetical protein IAU59_006874 [Kwoniella sp. CBS 9459]
MSDPSSSSSSSDTDPDLRDVFALLYADDDWTFNTSDSEDAIENDGRRVIGNEKISASVSGPEEVHPPLDAFIPEADLERIERSIDVVHDHKEVEGEGSLIDVKKYSRKRFMDAIDSLFASSSSTSSSTSIGADFNTGESTKRRRIYARPVIDTSSSPSIITSTQSVSLLPQSTATAYIPFSPLALLSRLRTYRIHTYPYPSLYPETLSPISAALNGWTNNKCEGLACGYCGVEWSLSGLAEISDEIVRTEVARRLSEGFRGRHKEGCAWGVRRSPDELYAQLRNLLHPAISSHLAPLAERLSIALPYPYPCASPNSVSYSTPLTPSQQATLVSSLRHHTSSPLSRLNANMALFGWYPYYPKSPSSSSHIDDSTIGVRTEIVHCRFCERRVGLWAFARLDKHSASVAGGDDGISTDGLMKEDNDKDTDTDMERSFDLVNEHLGWCPVRPRTQTRHDFGKEKEKPWWAGCALLREKKGVSSASASASASAGNITYIEQDGRANKGWVTISDKLEKKPWRR